MGERSRVLVVFTEKTQLPDRVNGHSIATNGGKFCLNGPQILHGVSTMLVRKLGDCEEFVAGDNSILRELLHPDKQPIDLRYSLAHAILPVGETSLPHSLTTSEVYYIMAGRGEMHIDGEVQIIEPGDAVYIPPNAKQFVRSLGPEPLTFICLVDPAWRKEDETVYESEP